MNLLIAGDMVPKENNIDFFRTGKIDKILGEELRDIWKQSDYKIFNLEAPITECEEKIKKNGPNLKISSTAIKGIKDMEPTCVLLANNHVMDYGEKGLQDTLDILDTNNINWIGVGENKFNIDKSFVIEAEGKKIVIYNCCENEFSLATSKKPGANGSDFLELYNDIRMLKEKNTFLIIVYHGGKEHYRYPSPHLQELCRKMVDYGADLIVCQHSHCIGCYEKYKDKTIVYGQGNFIFDGPNNEYWNTSLIINLDISKKMNVEYIPTIRTETGTRLATQEEKNRILDLFISRSEEIKKENFIEKQYKEFSIKYFDLYLQKCHGDNMVFRILNKICAHKLTSKLYSKRSLLALLNIIECEAHRELFIEGLKNKIFDNK